MQTSGLWKILKKLNYIFVWPCLVLASTELRVPFGSDFCRKKVCHVSLNATKLSSLCGAFWAGAFPSSAGLIMLWKWCGRLRDTDTHSWFAGFPPSFVSVRTALSVLRVHLIQRFPRKWFMTRPCHGSNYTWLTGRRGQAQGGRGLRLSSAYFSSLRRGECAMVARVTGEGGDWGKSLLIGGQDVWGHKHETISATVGNYANVWKYRELTRTHIWEQELSVDIKQGKKMYRVLHARVKKTNINTTELQIVDTVVHVTPLIFSNAPKQAWRQQKKNKWIPYRKYDSHF